MTQAETGAINRAAAQELPEYYSESLESAVIGAVGFMWDVYKPRVTELLPDDFHFGEHKALITQLREIYADAPDIDFVLLCSRLSTDAAQMFMYYAGHARSVNITELILRLKELAANRRVKIAVNALLTEGKVITAGDLLKIAENEQTRAEHTYKAKAQERLSGWVSDIGKPQERIRTGFKNIDGLLNGLRIPSVSIIGAYPSVGKTALALNIIASLCLFGEKGVPAPTVFFSLEMSIGAIYERIISNVTKINYNDIIAQNLSPDELGTFRKYAGVMQKMPLYVFDDVYHIENQNAAITQIKPKFVVVDYVQKVRTHTRQENRRAEIEYISGMYKQIAAANNCHIMLLSQLSRSGKESPTMGSLKESGALEADGDYVMLLHRPYVLDKKGKYADGTDYSPEDASLLIDKNKYGRTGVQQMRFIGRYQRFTETERAAAPAKKKSGWKNWAQAAENDEAPF